MHVDIEDILRYQLCALISVYVNVNVLLVEMEK